ncbi:putative capsid protein [Freshwater macrophyte associated picorna-like virus 9]|nr:putative capsid protein [Freshwater macrophyte associated picorna-like virus 9]
MTRPVQVFQGELDIGQAFSLTLNPWQLFFENPRVFARIKNFRNLRCDMRIKVVVNGNPFYYGSYLAFYVPLHGNDGRTSRSSETAALVQYSQCPHLYIDPCTSTAGELHVPYFNPKDAMCVPDKDWTEMGEFRIETIAPLQHSNDGTESITLTVFAMAENIQLSTPTINEPVENQSDEYRKPSAIAHSIAWGAGWLSQFPTIAPYMRATQMIATSLGDVASMFGFSRPRIVSEPSSARLRIGSNLAATNVQDNIACLAVDAKKEVTIDPRVVGLQPNDEMMLTPIAMRESFLTSFPWTENEGAGAHLFSVRVNPAQINPGAVDISLTPSAFVSLPFKYWRGSMKFRFNVIASAYHRGRLKFVWDPDFSPSGSGSVYNTNYIQVVDIAQNRDVIMDIGWGSNFSYLRVGGIMLDLFSTSAFTERNPFCNGTLSVFVVNELTSPGPTASDVSVAVFSSMMDDFELACPDASMLLSSVALSEFALPDTGWSPQIEPQMPAFPGVDPPAPEPPSDLINVEGLGVGTWVTAFQSVKSTFQRETDGDIVAAANGRAGFIVPNIGASLNGYMEIQAPPSSTFNTGLTLYEKDNTIVGTQTVDIVTDAMGLATVPFSIPYTTPSSDSVLHFGIFAPNTMLLFKLTVLELQGIAMKPYAISEITASESTCQYTQTPEEITFTFTGTNQVLSLALEEEWPLNSVAHLTIRGTSGRVLNVTPGNTYSTFSNGPTRCGGVVAKTVEVGGKPTLQIWPFNADNLGDEYKLSGLIMMAKAIQNQSEEVSTNPAAEPLANQPGVSMGPRLPGGEVNQVYFGEHVTSWRQMLKRYDTIQRGVYPSSTSIRWADNYPNIGTGPLTVGLFSILQYVKSAYVGCRGGYRLKCLIQPSIPGTEVFAYISNISDAERTRRSMPSLINFSGSTVDYIPVCGTVDAEIPYYSNLRFLPPRYMSDPYSWIPDLDRGRQRLDCAITVKSPTEFSMEILQAVAEDFSLHFFLCAPRLFVPSE